MVSVVGGFVEGETQIETSLPFRVILLARFVDLNTPAASNIKNRNFHQIQADHHSTTALLWPNMETPILSP